MSERMSDEDWRLVDVILTNHIEWLRPKLSAERAYVRELERQNAEMHLALGKLDRYEDATYADSVDRTLKKVARLEKELKLARAQHEYSQFFGVNKYPSSDAPGLRALREQITWLEAELAKDGE